MNSIKVEQINPRLSCPHNVFTWRNWLSKIKLCIRNVFIHFTALCVSNNSLYELHSYMVMESFLKQHSWFNKLYRFHSIWPQQIEIKVKTRLRRQMQPQYQRPRTNWNLPFQTSLHEIFKNCLLWSKSCGYPILLCNVHIQKYFH